MPEAIQLAIRRPIIIKIMSAGSDSLIVSTILCWISAQVNPFFTASKESNIIAAITGILASESYLAILKNKVIAKNAIINSDSHKFTGVFVLFVITIFY